MASQHQKALAWAHAHLGEREQPPGKIPGTNTGPFVQDCQAATWLPGTRWPWCVAFFIRAWKAAGVVLPWRGASAFGFHDWAKGAGWLVASGDAVPGDAVIIKAGAGHCAMLSDFVNGTNVSTINGNWGDAVKLHTFHLSEVLGFIHVPEPKVVKQTPPAKPGVWEVATSASGHRKLVYVSGPKAVGRKLPELLNRYGGLTISRRKKSL